MGEFVCRFQGIFGRPSGNAGRGEYRLRCNKKEFVSLNRVFFKRKIEQKIKVVFSRSTPGPRESDPTFERGWPPPPRFWGSLKK